MFKKMAFVLRFAGWPKLLLPAALGQSFGFVAAGHFSVAGCVLATGFTLSGLACIVLLNDWGDQFVDRVKRKMFPTGCSPKTIPDGILPAAQVLKSGLFLAAFAWFWGAAGIMLDRPWLPVLAAIGLLLFFSYTFPPLRLNYRGGGELLEAFGVGFWLPWLNAYSQSGELWNESYWLLPGFVLPYLGSALASGLSDEESDRVGGKRTFTTISGNRAVRHMVLSCMFLTPFLWGLLLMKVPGISLWLLFLPGLVMLVAGLAVSQISPLAGTRQFRAQKTLKHYLHLGLWLSTLIWALEFLGVAAIVGS